MFDSTKLVIEYANLLGWKPHFDNTITIPAGLSVSDSGQYYQQKHPALRLDLIKATLPPSYPLPVYLENTVLDSVKEMFNDVLQYRQISDYGKTILNESILLNRYARKNDVIINLNRFVGFQIKVNSMTGLTAMINEMGLQFTSAETFDMYLFHSSKTEPLKVFEVSTTGNGSMTWKKIDLELSAFKSEEYQGGVFILGYYQSDLNSTAINYSNFNWVQGECGTCNNSFAGIWKSIRGLYHIHPIYSPNGSYVKGELPDLQSGFLYSDTESFGMNLKLSAKCDLTDFFIDNKSAFVNLLALKVASKIVSDMKYSQQTNHAEENLKAMIIGDVDGFVDQKSSNLPTQYRNELKAVTFNMSGINAKCLGCEAEKYTPVIGVV